MAEDSLRSAIDAIRSRLHEELETQLAQLSARQADEVEQARRAAEAEAEQRWSAKVDEVRSEWTSRLESEVATVRADAERRMVAESLRLRVEAEQAAAERAAASREELERALAEERARGEEQVRARLDEYSAERGRLEEESAAHRARFEAQAVERARIEEQLAEARTRAEEHTGTVQRHAQDLEAERRRADELDAQRLRAEDALNEHRLRLSGERDELVRTLDAARHELAGLEGELARVTSELSAERDKRHEDGRNHEARDTALAEARLAERQSQLAIVERVLTAVRAMDGAKSLSDVLASLTSSAAAEAPRVALFVLNGLDLRGWKSAGFHGEAAALHASTKDPGLLGEALRRRETVVTAQSDGPAAPEFARLPAGRAAIAVPLLVGNQPVAVLYADDAADGTPAAPASWPEAIQILGRHASVTLAHLTAARAADAMRRSLSSPSAGHAAAPAANAKEDGNSARRYARLLVSEIKLYNEAAVAIGRQKRDLLTRLKPEIDRARKLYAQRISPAVDSRGRLFQQELVQTLADGDASLLGTPA